MLVILAGAHKPLFEYIDQFIKPADTEICVGMFSQMSITLIDQQHRCSASSVAGGHVIDAITNLESASDPIHLTMSLPARHSP